MFTEAQHVSWREKYLFYLYKGDMRIKWAFKRYFLDELFFEMLPKVFSNDAKVPQLAMSYGW